MKNHLVLLLVYMELVLMVVVYVISYLEVKIVLKRLVFLDVKSMENVMMEYVNVIKDGMAKTASSKDVLETVLALVVVNKSRELGNVLAITIIMAKIANSHEKLTVVMVSTMMMMDWWTVKILNAVLARCVRKIFYV